ACTPLMLHMATWKMGTRPVRLTETEQLYLAHRPTANLEAYERFLQAEDVYYNRLNRNTIHQALTLYEQAVSLDPEFAEAHAGLAFVTYVVRLAMWDNIMPRVVALERSQQALERALALNPSLPQALSLKSLHSWEAHRFDEAVELGATAVANGPNHAVVRSRFARVLAHAGRHEEAAAALETTLRLEPHPSAETLFHIGRTLYLLRQYEHASAFLERAQAAIPNSQATLVTLAASYAQLGRMGEAQAVLKQVKKRSPGLSLATIGAVGRCVRPSNERPIWNICSMDCDEAGSRSGRLDLCPVRSIACVAMRSRRWSWGANGLALTRRGCHFVAHSTPMANGYCIAGYATGRYLCD
uniref:tetratricopeptide repeat protein n=1 Tax=Candidatus Entotheonella palauensis TaxID=93172 RepID=UPI0011775506